MIWRFPRLFDRALVLGLSAAFLFTLPAFSQEDPDPNSPTPVLLSIANTNRVMATPRSRLRSKFIPQSIQPRAFQPNSRIDLFIKNIHLLEDEDFRAFRVYAQDARQRAYRFPVIGLRLSDFDKSVYVLTVQLRDEIGFWEPPAPDGDLLIQVAWRGLGSNRLRLGYGKLGGSVKDDSPNASPAVAVMTTRKNNFAQSVDSDDLVAYRWSGDRMRFLEQAAFGPTPMLDSRIRRIGIRTWLAEQFEAPYPSLSNPYPNQPLKPGNPQSDCDGDTTIPDVPVTCFRDSYTMYQPQTWFFKEAFYGDAQLRHRVAWALSQIWVTSGVDIQQGRHMVEYHKMLSRNAFGNYRNLMKEMTLGATMGDYLDMVRSTKNNPNENYAREIMQLFTVGLFMLNQDGTLQRDGSNNPIPTYDQNTVNSLTKVLTGWGFCQNTAVCPNAVAGTLNFIDPLLLNTNNHDLTAKTLLNYPGSTTSNIGACSGCNSAAIATYANISLDQALDNIYGHPNLGPFVSKLLIQHLVASDPTPAYVSRVAAVFNANRSSPTQMKEVVRAILIDPEARGDVKTDPNYGKLREPVQLATNLLRTFNVRSADGLSQSDGYLTGRGEFNGMSQIPFRSPTVFNYYPPDNVVPGTALLGPEFALMTTGTSIQRANFVNVMVFSVIAGGNVNAPTGTSLDFGELQAFAAADTTGNQLLDALNQKMLHNTMSSAMRNTILTAVTNIASSNPRARAQQAVYLIATSSQYQVQR